MPVTAVGIICTEIDAFLALSAVVTVMVAAPTALPKRRPFGDTVAIAALLVAYEIPVFVASDGTTVAISCWDLPTVNGAAPINSTFETGIAATVIDIEAEIAPIDAIIVAIPGLFPVTTPIDVTVATVGLFVLNTMIGLLAFDGVIVVASKIVLPTVTAVGPCS